MIYTCCENSHRRQAVKQHATLNGIDFVEVLDLEAPPGSPRQRTLIVHLFKPVTVPGTLTLDNVTILGGDRIKPVRVEWIVQASNVPATWVSSSEAAYFLALSEPYPAGTMQPDHVLIVRTDSGGDHSNYTLRFVVGNDNLAAVPGFDPVLSEVDFSFKVECPTDFDCATPANCPDTPLAEPDIDYLAKDYASFRQSMLDRMAQIMPDWRERNPADLGVALVELLAYVGDHLSYRQDAVATEAYLGTARLRTSARRHATLVDYAMHDGCNARVWVRFEVAADCLLPQSTPVLTSIANKPVIIADSGPAYGEALLSNPVVFETMQDASLFLAHNQMDFYTWSDDRCCLPRGATRATLAGHYPKLQAGDVLVFEEIRSPLTGATADADREHRHAVRLVAVKAFEVEPVSTTDPGIPLTDPLPAPPQAITEIRWHDDDALPFPVCISALTQNGQPVSSVSVALGNIVLADHGRKIKDENLGKVPAPHLFLVPATGDNCVRPDRIAVPPRFHPALQQGPLTQAAPCDLTSATASMTWQAAAALPAITLASVNTTGSWTARRDLLASTEEDANFVAEVESNGVATLRFGDDQHGSRPPPNMGFSATYRIGNGSGGNIGADTLGHVVTSVAAIASLRNPLAARGGSDPETIQEVRTRAPYAFRTQKRAVTPKDYAAVTEQLSGIQEAAATFRWTGSWHTVFITVDRDRGDPVDEPFKQTVYAQVEPFRMAGYDLEVNAPHFVPLEVEMQVCVRPEYFRSQVKKALDEVFSGRVLADGTLGVFHPDNFSFGDPVYLSRLYAAAQRIPGVDSVTITKFQREGIADRRPLEDGVLALDRLEIACLANDPDYPDRGTLTLKLGGGM